MSEDARRRPDGRQPDGRGGSGAPRSGSGRSGGAPGSGGTPRSGGAPRSAAPASGRPPGWRPRRTSGDPARGVAFDVLRQVDASDAYANLVLPGLLRERGLDGRDAAFATELTYGTLRGRGRYDAVLERCTRGRPLAELDPPVLDVLRLGTHQLLAMRVPSHAAVSETVSLTRDRIGTGASAFVNAVLRAVAAKEPEAWLTEIADAADPAGTDEVARLSVLESHPAWITRALRGALLGMGRPASELADLLRADNANPDVTLVARPGLVTPAELAAEARSLGAEPVPGRWAPTALVLPGGDPGSLPAVRHARAGVQDEGSQLVALALAAAPVLPDGADPADGRWLDLCAGPGGKAALLGALAAERGATLVANEVAPHRARLVRQSVAALPRDVVDVRTGDGREIGETEPGRYDRVLVDAPCTGLGALRRRPEARWRRQPGDLAALGTLQRALLAAAVDATRSGGVVAYVTCSPHPAETTLVVQDVLRRRDDVELLDAVAVLQEVAREEVPGLSGPMVQLWPHLHGTDAMFLALLRKR
ncbi:transcription antitermination factor NusB [Georgenia faecalis]|uniref:transcription antitermination factor NusB n=1 Tax=Georgenia faecalis TaxID=2483799 RepID=UPI000F07BBA5|nr:transcription antitermination factor NusB [Georgenia faecalis]